MAYDTGQVGSVGTLVGSALETAGHYLQSQLLDVFESGLAYSFGTLLYLLAAITAFFMVAVGGKYKFGLYFLLGPAVFFQVAMVRTPSDGAMWRFGDQAYPEASVHDISAGVTSVKQQGQPAVLKDIEVSWFFAMWNEFCSEVVNSFIHAIRVTNSKGNLSFVVKSERYFEYFKLKITDPQIQKFIVLTSQNKCSRYYALMFSYWNPMYTSNERDTMFLSRLNELGNQVAFGSSDEQKLFEWFNKIGVTDRLIDWFPNDQSNPFEERDGEVRLRKNSYFTCHDTWRVTIRMLKTHATELIEDLATKSVPEGMTSDETEAKLRVKFQQLLYGTESDGMRIVISDPQNGAAIAMINELAVRLFVKELQGRNPNIAQYGRSPSEAVAVKAGEVYNPDTSHAIRMHSSRGRWQGKGDFYTAILAMPYIQGLVLYFLAATYPFFAMCLLIPGRHHGFSLWMGLWFWIKSWDLGYAVVMIIDEMLYAMLPHGPPVQSDIIDSPHEAIKMIMEVDPTYSEDTYYNLIAACMMAVPAITGIMVKKGGREVLQAIEGGYINFAGRSGHSLGAFYGSLRAQDFKRAAHTSALGQVKKAEAMSMVDPNVMGNVMKSITLQSMSNVLSKGLDVANVAKLRTTLRSNGIGGAFLKKLTQGATAGVVADVLAAESTRYMNVAKTEASANLARSGYLASMEKINRDRASDGVRQRWYSHDMTLPPPIASEVKALASRFDMQTTKVFDSGIRPLLVQPRATSQYLFGLASEQAEQARRCVGNDDAIEARRMPQACGNLDGFQGSTMKDPNNKK